MRRALNIDEASFGPNHPSVSIRLSNLAQLLYSANRFAEAEPLRQRALAIDETTFGPVHPEVATDLNNLSQLLKSVNRHAEAEPLMRRAWRITLLSEKRNGHKHANHLSRKERYTSILKALGHTEDQIAAKFAEIQAEVEAD